MSRANLTALWASLGLFLVYYAVNSYIRTQGGEPILDAKLVVSGRTPAAVVGIVVCSVTLLLVALVGRRYARHPRSGHEWHRRLPVVGLKGLNTGSTDGQVYQAASLVVFLGLPLIALVHFWRVMLNSPVVSNTTQLPLSLWDLGAFLAQPNNPAKICTDAGNPECVTYLPGLEPTLLLVVTLAAVAMVGWQLATIFRR